MNKIKLFSLIAFIISISQIAGQNNTISLLAKIDKYKIYATFSDGKQDGNSIQDTTSALIQKTFFFLKTSDSLVSYIKSNNIIFALIGDKGLPKSFQASIVPISIDKGVVNIDPFKIIRLPRNKWAGGIWEINMWYCLKNYNFIDIMHIQCIEKCYKSQNDGTELSEVYKVIYLIDYTNKSVTEISRIKIE